MPAEISAWRMGDGDKRQPGDTAGSTASKFKASLPSVLSAPPTRPRASRSNLGSDDPPHRPRSYASKPRGGVRRSGVEVMRAGARAPTRRCRASARCGQPNQPGLGRIRSGARNHGLLHSHGVGTARAVRIFKTVMGNDACRWMAENPYRLATRHPRHRSRTADAIAARLGMTNRPLIRLRPASLTPCWRRVVMPTAAAPALSAQAG